MLNNSRRGNFLAILILQALILGLMLLIVGLFPEAAPAASPSAPLSPTLPDVQITVDEIVATGFLNPIGITHAGDGSGRLFVIEQTGAIRIVRDGNVLDTPFLDLSDAVIDGSERGLLGLAFHPNYATNGQFFVNYTRAGDGATVIARYNVSTADPDRADPNSAQVLLTVAQPYGNHNAGHLAFGPTDGYLYVALGDGGSGGDPLDHGQNIDTLLGALLRLDVDAGTPYAIPVDNPFIGAPGQDEIWAYGLRNPWRFSFDRATGDLYIGDVGQNQWEEIDYQSSATPGGLNFGWRCKEGSHIYNFGGDCPQQTLIDPIAEYDHTQGRSVTGGHVYRGLAYPALEGRYFYADYVTGKIWSLYQTGSDPITWSPPELELDTSLNISSFGEDEEGELYVIDRSGGTLRRLADVNGPTPNLITSRKQASTPSANPGDTVTYTLQLVNTGGLATETAQLTDTVPAGLTYVPGSLAASEGAVDDQAAPQLTWLGDLSTNRRITVTYQVTVTGQVTGSIVNQARLTAASLAPLTLTTALAVPRSVLTTTPNDFFLPGTQPGDLHASIPSSVDCDICHNAPIYDRWRGSMMSQAGRDPLMWAALSVANVDAPSSGDYCLRCHTPKGWLEGRSHPADGSALQASDIQNGVACNFCHRLVDPVASPGDEASEFDAQIRADLAAPPPPDYAGSATAIVDPDDRRRGPFSFNLSLPYHTAYQTDLFQQTSDAVTRSRHCGTCHNVDNPVLSWDPDRLQYWPNAADSPPPEVASGQLFPVERTYDEWLYSDFARGGVYDPRFAARKPGGIVESCQDCHLPRAVGTAADAAFNPVLRDCQTTGCLPKHTMVGGNTWTPQLLQIPAWRLSAPAEAPYLHDTMRQAQQMLHKAATLTVTLATSGTVKIATVRVTNHAGHKLPTGYPEGRQMWLNLKAFDGNDNLIHESGAYDPSTGQLQRTPDTQVYEVKQGITPQLAALVGKPDGSSFHFVLNNYVVKDNRIPPRGYNQALFDQPGLRPVGAVYADGQHWDDTIYTLPIQTERVVVTLRYQTASKEYVDFLQANGGVDGLALGRLWQSLKSPPEVMAWASIPSYEYYLPLVLQQSKDE
ncbi:MAG: PQQ-dependent sugar dehydrogenase [Anaerolineae bacterium]|jgi:uncharacterized repeat protein (TIGR01451 family)